MNCPRCPHATPTITPDGTGRYPIMFVSESLDADSGRAGRMLTGRYGRILAKHLPRGTRWTDFWGHTAAGCSPTPSTLRTCALTCTLLDTYVSQVQPKVFVALDPLSFERLTGITAPSIVTRGYIYPEVRGRGWVIPTLAPGGQRKGLTYEANPGMLGTFTADVEKAIWLSEQPDFAYQTFDTFWRPERTVWDAYVREFLADPSRPLAVDTEYPWKRASEMSDKEKAAALDLTDRIDEVNVAFEPHRGGSVPWADPYREGVLAMLHASQQHGTTLFWNIRADAPRLTASGGPVFTPEHSTDLMDMFRVWRNSTSRRLAVAATLWPSLRAVKPWKHLGTGDAYYRAMDAISLIHGLADMTEGLKAEGAWEVYRLTVADLDPVLHRMTQAGLWVDQERVSALAATTEAQMLSLRRTMSGIVPPEVRKEKKWKSLSAAQSGLERMQQSGEVLPEATLEECPGAERVNRCECCGEVGVKAGHVGRKTMKDAR